MQNGRESIHLLRACQALVDASGTSGKSSIEAPHLSLWLRGLYSPSAEALLEITEIILRRLLNPKPADTGWHKELFCVRLEAEVHQLEAVLTRAKAVALRNESSHLRTSCRLVRGERLHDAPQRA